jgi:energy-coupling factor transporter ATP-binding protein EcfA2
MITGKKLVETQALNYSYSSSGRELIIAIKDVSLTVVEGEFLSIIGQNGAGKTTLAKHFNGLLKPTGGKVYVDGIETAGRTVAQLAKVVGYVFQDPDRMLFLNTVEEELKFGPTNLGLSRDEVTTRMDEVAVNLDLKEYYGLSPFQLGKSAKRRLAIASVLTMKPRMIVIDEPSVGQDRSRTDLLMGYLQRLNREEGIAIAVITHDMRLVAEYTDRVLVLSAGELLFDGRARVLFKENPILERAGLEPPQITQLSISMPNLFPEPTLSVGEAARRLAEVIGASSGTKNPSRQ